MKLSVRITALLIIMTFVVISFSGVQPTSSYFESDSHLSGPYLDEVIYTRNWSFLELLSGEIDIHTDIIYSSYYPQLEADPDI